MLNTWSLGSFSQLLGGSRASEAYYHAENVKSEEHLEVVM